MGSGGSKSSSGLPWTRHERTSRQRYPNAQFGPIVALIAAYQEELNIGDVLKAMPTMVGDAEVTTLVVVDGGATTPPVWRSTPGCSPVCYR